MSGFESRIEVVRDDQLPEKYASYYQGDTDIWHAFARAYKPDHNVFITLHVAVSWGWLRSQIGRVLWELQEARGAGYDVDSMEGGWFDSVVSVAKIAKDVVKKKMSEKAKDEGAVLPPSKKPSAKALAAAQSLLARAKEGDPEAKAKIAEVVAGFKAGDPQDTAAMYLLAEQSEIAGVMEGDDEIGAKLKGKKAKAAAGRWKQKQQKKGKARGEQAKAKAKKDFEKKMAKDKRKLDSRISAAERRRAEEDAAAQEAEENAAREAEEQAYQRDLEQQRLQMEQDRQQRAEELRMQMEQQRADQQMQMQMMQMQMQAQAAQAAAAAQQPQYAPQQPQVVYLPSDEGGEEDDGGDVVIDQGEAELQARPGEDAVEGEGTEFNDLAQRGWDVRRALGDYIPGDDE